ncbi:MAG: OmpA family protein [Bacteroidales bacterium]
MKIGCHPKILLPSTKNCQLLLAAVLIAISANTANAQSNSFKQTFIDAEYYILQEDYREALPLYQKLYRMDSTNANINFRLGQCYLNIPGVKSRAIPYLGQAVQNLSPEYAEGSYRETNAPLPALLNLGMAYMVTYDFDEALRAFAEFRDKIEVKDIYNFDYVNQQITACKMAKRYVGKPINTEAERFNPFPDRSKSCNYPVISGDGQTMIFTVNEKFYNAIYYCTKEQEQWGIPKNITMELAVEGEAYTTTLNHNGTLLLIFRNEKTSGNIYSSNLVNGKWQPVKKLNGDVTTKDRETFASFSPDGQHLLFTSNRKAGAGGLDIYVADLLPNGTWGNVQNLSSINTPFDEVSPVLSADGKTLYFASKGHSSMGGFDIFRSQLSSNGKWSAPINLGYPINTPDDEYYYFPLDSASALIPLTRKGMDSYYDIYRITVKPQETTTTNIDGKVTLGDNADFNSDSICINIRNTDTTLIASIKPSSVNGEFHAYLQPGWYTVGVTSKYYSMDTLNIYIPENYGQKILPISLQLVPNIVYLGFAPKFTTILFEFDSYALNRDAQFELEKVFNLLDTYPNLYIKVNGYPDSKVPTAENQKLAAKRAKSVAEYLISKGLDERRFVVNGLDTPSADDSDNLAGKNLYGRASIKILSNSRNIQLNDVDTPENLKPQNQSYTILLAKPNDSIRAELVRAVEKELDLNSITTSIGAKTYVNIGTYPGKSQAVATLNKVIDLYMPTATLVGSQELNRLIGADLQNLVTSKTVFTVLLLTGEEPVDAKTFKSIMPIQEKGDDGFYRYYFGIFTSREAAQKQLEKFNALGFPNAMIVKLTKW